MVCVSAAQPSSGPELKVFVDIENWLGIEEVIIDEESLNHIHTNPMGLIGGLSRREVTHFWTARGSIRIIESQLAKKIVTSQ